MIIVEMDAGCLEFPEHDHVADGAQELYVVLKGDGVLRANGQDYELRVGTLIRVGPDEKRKVIPGVGGITVLTVGATGVAANRVLERTSADDRADLPAEKRAI